MKWRKVANTQQPMLPTLILNEFIFNLRKHENASLSSKVDNDSSTEGNVSNREQFKVCYIVKLPKFHLKMASSKMTIFIRTLINIPKFTKPLIMDILVVIIWNCGTFVGWEGTLADLFLMSKSNQQKKATWDL